MTRSLYNANDGLTGRDGGPYLDQVEAVEAEKRRALVEGREPDLEHPPATAGIQLNTAAQMLRDVPVPHPSQTHVVHDAASASYKSIVEDDNYPLQVFAEIPDAAFEKGDGPTDEEKAGPDIGDDLHAASVDGSLADNSKTQTQKEPDSGADPADAPDEGDFDIVFTSDTPKASKSDTKAKSTAKTSSTTKSTNS